MRAHPARFSTRTINTSFEYDDEREDAIEVTVYLGPSGGTGRAESCADGNESCATWAAAGECHGNPDYMLLHCSHSCGVCSDDGGGGRQHDLEEL